MYQAPPFNPTAAGPHQFFGPSPAAASSSEPDYRAAWGRIFTTPAPTEVMPGLPPIPRESLEPIRELVLSATYLRIQASAGALPSGDDPEGLELLADAEATIREWADHCGLMDG